MGTHIKDYLMCIIQGVIVNISKSVYCPLAVSIFQNGINSLVICYTLFFTEALKLNR